MGLTNSLKLEKIEKVSSDDISEWKNYFKKNVQTTIAHSFSLGLILQKTYGYSFEPYKILKDNNIVGFIPFCRIDNKLVSMPHFSYGSVLNDIVDSGEDLVKLFNQLECDKFEVRGFNICSPYFSDEKVSCFLRLEESPEKQMILFKSKLRSQIKKGIKNKLDCKIGGNELLNDFYYVYSSNMHSKGSPVLAKLFFYNLINDYEDGLVNIHVIYHNKKPIGASFVISYFDFMEVCWASTLREFNNLQPNMIMYWRMISNAIENGIKLFSFGRSTKNSSTHRFKKQWGCEDIQLYFNYSKEPKRNIKNFSFLFNFWKIIPFKLALVLGPIVTKKIY